MKKTSYISILIISYFLIGCSTIYYPTGTEYPENKERRNDEIVLYPFADMEIPNGHLPPPGECKIWFPERPAGQQPPPQSCSSAIMNKPLGAWIITHETNRYRVVSFIRTERGIVEEIKYFREQ